MTLPELIDIMTKAKALRVKTADFEVELHPLAFVGPAEPETKQGAFAADIADKRCNCSHPLTEHSEHGLCLQGCSSDACGLGDAHA